MLPPILIKGAPGSPYTRKMLALLRYRRLPYRLIAGGLLNDDARLPRPRVPLLPTLYLPNAQGELEALVDSTPLIRRLESDWPDERGVVPDDAALDFLDALIEDYADEWLTKAMFHYRWSYQADIDHAGAMLPRWHALGEPEDVIAERREMIVRRQIERLWVVGSNPVTAPLIEASYRRVLECLDAHLQRHPFLLGRRPGSADFALYGQLTQLARFDPTPQALALAVAPRVCAWVDVVEDLSGLEADAADWVGRDEAAAALEPWLAELGRTYVPVMLANARALDAGEAEVRTTVAGQPWVQRAFPYQGRCVAEMRARRARLDAADRAFVDDLLARTGCDALFA